MRSTPARALVVFALTFASACGSGSTVGATTSDGSTTSPADAGADTGATAVRWPGTCDPVAQDCPAGQQCTAGCMVAGVMSKTFTCAPPPPDVVDGGAGNGQVCGTGCARGSDCFAIPVDGGIRKLCRKYCNDDRDCPGSRCVAEGVVCAPGDPMPIGRFCAL